MRRLFVCLVVLSAAALTAHFFSAVARLSADELAARCADFAVERMSLVVPAFRETEIPALLLGYFLRPGAYAISRVGVDPATMPGLCFAALIGWWLWLTAVRLTWSVAGQGCGLINAAMFHVWIRLAIPWRPPYRIYLGFRRWWKQFRYGPRATAAWTGILAAMTLIYKPGDCVYLGRLWMFGVGLWQSLGLRGPRHVTVVAASGAGKTRWLMAWLGMMHAKASAFVIDIDGQIVNSLGRPLERKGHKVLNLDLYGLTRFPCACWNAVDEITRAVKRHGRAAAVRFAQTLAEALIKDDNKHQPVFATSARVFLLGLILYVWMFEPEERRNLVRVRELLTRGLPELVLDPEQDPFDVLLSVMEQSVEYDDECGGKIVAVIARAAGVMKAGKTREGNPFRSTAISQTSWLDLPEIAAISQRSDFACEDLKTGNLCLFVCVPVVDIQTKLSGWVRALTMMGLYAFQNMPGNRTIPCVFAIDETPNLGRMELLETAAPVFRRFGVRLVIVTQDLERLRQMYPNSWGGFIGNSQCTLWMSTDHQETLEYLSRILGTTTYIEEISSAGWFSKGPRRVDRCERPLMTPDQLREFLDPERGQFIVTRTGKPPLRVSYAGYDKALAIDDYDRDLNFREPLLRAMTRGIVNWIRPQK
jgi:type IV secretory pathway TraG/TraD family ATPase VirD4